MCVCIYYIMYTYLHLTMHILCI